MMRRCVLLTRPVADVEPLASEVKARGFDVFSEPMLDIKMLPVQKPDIKSYQALVFTSANAVRAVKEWGAGLMPVYCVGDITAQAAHEAGFRDIRNSGGAAADLLTLLAVDITDNERPLLHLSGKHIARTIDVAGLVVKNMFVYEAVPATAFSPEIIDLFDQTPFFAAAFLSARTGRNFANLLEKCGRTDKISTTKALCLSDTVLQSISHLPWQDVQVANRPERKALVEILEDNK